MTKAKKLERPTYSIEIKYSEDAIKNKLMRFVPVDGKSFEISSEEMISFLVNEVNLDTLSPAFVDMEKINLVSVGRQIAVKLDRDFKAGEEIRLNYIHPYPLEFAILEAMHGMAVLDKDVKYITLTNEKIEELKGKITPEMEHFYDKFYESIKGAKKKEGGESL